MMKRALYIFFSVLFLCSLLVTSCAKAPPAEGELNLYGIDPITLDPAVSGEMTSHEYIAQIFGGLVRLDDNLEPAPDIAERWEVSDDGRTYTFYLRKDVKFHNGRQVKAWDFKYSLERACDPDTGSRTAETYLGDIVGVKEVLEGKTREISGVRVIDDYTLQITIDAPKSYFLSKLTYPTG
ncbi:MAG: ABC transporter substrate-binding protein, partial [Dehalococcoidales bacterium]